MQRPGAREREALLFAAGEDARRTVHQMLEPYFLERLDGGWLALDERHAGEVQRIKHVPQRRAPQHHRALEDHRLRPSRTRRVLFSPEHLSPGGYEQPV